MVTVNFSIKPNLSTLSNSLKGSPIIWLTLAQVSGIKGAKSEVPITILSTKLYKTVLSLSTFSGSLASAQGIVSSIYLFARLNTLRTSLIASETLNSFILAVTLSLAPVTTNFNSSSTGSITLAFSTTPSKYLLLIAIVRLTRLP